MKLSEIPVIKGIFADVLPDSDFFENKFLSRGTTK